MATQFPNPTNSYINIYTDAGWTMPEIEKFAIYQQPNTSVFMMLEQKLGATELAETKAKDRIVYTPRYGNIYPTQTIDSRSPSSGASAMLTLNWPQTDFETFETNAKLKSLSGAYGTIVSRSAGQVVIAPFGTTTFGATDFLGGENVQYLGVITNDSSDSPERQVFEPTKDYNYIPLQRKEFDLGMDEANRYMFLATDNSEQGHYYAHIGLKQTTENMMKQYMIGQIENNRLLGADGTYMQGGYKWQIKNTGGVDDPFTTLLTEDLLTAHINKIHNNNGTRGDELLAIDGYGYASMRQLNIGKQYLVYAGDTNLIGGKEVKGIDTMKYAFNGFKISYYTDNLFKDNHAFPFISTLNVQGRGVTQQSNFCFYFDTSKVMTDGGDQPFIKCYYYGAAGMAVQKRDGLTTVEGKVSTNPTSGRYRGMYEIWISKMTQLQNPASASMHYLNG